MEIRAVQEATQQLVRMQGEPIGATTNSITAMLEAVETNICEDMPVIAREYFWAQQPENEHLRDDIYLHWHPTVSAIARIAQDATGPDATSSAAEWCAWLKRTHQQLQVCEDTRDGYKTHPNCIQTPNGTIATMPPESVPVAMPELIEVALDAPSATARANGIEYAIVRVHPFTDGNGRLSRLASNQLSLGRNIPASLQHRVYCQALDAMMLDDDPQPWVECRSWQLSMSGRMPTTDVEQTLNWCGEHSITWDPGTGQPEIAEYYREWTLVKRKQLATSHRSNRHALRDA